LFSYSIKRKGKNIKKKEREKKTASQELHAWTEKE
jgi:hypothetical protein